MTLKRLYSGNIGKKNIVGYDFNEKTSKKSSWEELKYIFVVPKKVKKKMISCEKM